MLLPIVGQRSGKWLRVQRRLLVRVQRSSNNQSKALSNSLRRKVQHQHGFRTTHITDIDCQC
jgi:hypothetical protein